MAIRSFFWRFGRYFYLKARGDLQLGPKKNGEHFIIEAILDLPNSFKIIVFDIGANKGEWTDKVDQMTKLSGIKMDAHLFEPAYDSYLYLKRKYQNCNHIILNHTAVLDYSGEANLEIVGELAGTNSVFNQSSPNYLRSEIVKVATLTEYDSLNANETIDFIKIDAEGSDFLIIKGAEELFRAGKVQICQFEYNQR
jgi:FkbM family methyltransferase